MSNDVGAGGKLGGNVGGADRIIRIVAGIAMMIGAATSVIPPWGWLGLLVLATGVFSMCPVYSLLRRSTAPAAQRRSK